MKCHVSAGMYAIQGYVCNNTQQNYLSVAWILGEERPGTRHAFDVWANH